MKKIYLYNLFSGMLFFMPLLLTIYREKNIDISAIFLIEAIYYLVIFIFEIPSGHLGDKFGHKKIAGIGIIGTALSYFLFFTSTSLFFIIFSQVLMAVFSTLISGSDEAFIFSVLEQENSQNEIYQIQKRNYVYFIIGNISSFIFGTVITEYGVNETFLLLLTGFSYVLAFLSFLSIRDIEQKDIKQFKPSKNFLKKNVPVILISGILLALLNNFYWIIQLFYQNLKLSNLTIGILFTISTGITISFSKILRLSETKYGSLLLALFPICYLMTISKSIWTIPFILFVYSLVKIEIVPFTSNLILKNTVEKRAFALSVSSWLNNAVQVFLLIGFYFMMKHMSFGYCQ